MKTQRWRSALLAVTMMLSLCVVPAAASEFPDVEGHWAESYIEAMTEAGMFQGYEDGTFRPENQLTTSEVLALCARAVPLDEDIEAEIAEARYDEVDEILDGAHSWFYTEFAICLETGILSHDDLQDIIDAGTMSSTVTKEQLSLYLVRAMQLEPMALGLTSYTLSFSDVDDISTELQPYIYLLSIYGIVQGDEDNNFGPQGSVTRAVMATMLSRALDFMEVRGVVVELPDYAEGFQQGIVESVSLDEDRQITLVVSSILTGEETSFLLSDEVVFYEYNMAVTSSSLVVGSYIRLYMDEDGEVLQLHIQDALQASLVTFEDMEDNQLQVELEGDSVQLPLASFAEVQVENGEIGDSSLINLESEYTDAVCYVDRDGQLVAVRLLGGNHIVQGLLSVVETDTAGDTTIQIKGLNGTIEQYQLSSDCVVTVNGTISTLNDIYVGRLVTLAVSYEDGLLVKLEINTEDTYIQGSVYKVSTGDSAGSVTITDLETGIAVSYTASTTCTYTYEGESITISSVEEDWFVTAQVDSKTLLHLECYPASVETAGTLTSYSFSTTDTTVNLSVLQVDGTSSYFTFDLTTLPDIIRNETDSTVDKLKVGDAVTITVRYQQVTEIQATSQGITKEGTIQRIVQEVSGITMDMLLTDGTEISYSIDSSVAVTQDDSTLTFASLSPGQKVELTIEGDEITAIDIQKTVSSSEQRTGTVVYVSEDEDNPYIYLRWTDSSGAESVITILTNSSTTYLEWDGTSIDLEDLEIGDWLQINGTFDSTTYVALLILRQ